MSVKRNSPDSFYMTFVKTKKSVGAEIWSRMYPNPDYRRSGLYTFCDRVYSVWVDPIRAVKGADCHVTGPLVDTVQNFA